MSTAQGTRQESHIVKRFREVGYPARRNARTAIKHEPDVTVEGSWMVPLLAWKHYKNPGGNNSGPTRRTTLSLVVLREDDFFDMLGILRRYGGPHPGFQVQCKATQRLSVPAVFAGLMSWMKANP